MNALITAVNSLLAVAKDALGTLAGMWIIAVPAAFYVIGLAVKFLFGLVKRKKRARP